MSNRALTKTLTYGVITRIGLPLCAVYLRWWDDGHGRLGDGFPVWIYSFFYCTVAEPAPLRGGEPEPEGAPIQQRAGGRRIEVHEAGARRPAARAARVNRHVLSGVTG